MIAVTVRGYSNRRLFFLLSLSVHNDMPATVKSCIAPPSLSQPPKLKGVV